MIRFALLMEAAIVISGLLFLVFQVILPLIRGTPFFPLLRAKRAKAIDALAEATEEREIDAIKKAAAGLGVVKPSRSTKGAN